MGAEDMPPLDAEWTDESYHEGASADAALDNEQEPEDLG